MASPPTNKRAVPVIIEWLPRITPTRSSTRLAIRICEIGYLAIMPTITYVGAGAYALDTVIGKLAITQRIPAIKNVLG